MIKHPEKSLLRELSGSSWAGIGAVRTTACIRGKEEEAAEDPSIHWRGRMRRSRRERKGRTDGLGPTAAASLLPCLLV